MNTEKEIVSESITESNLNQPKTAQAKMPFLRQVNTLSQIYKWNPTGFRVTLNLPIQSDDKNPLFFLRAYPFIPNPNEETIHYGYYAASVMFNYFRPIVHPASRTLTGYDWSLTDSKVVFVQYNLPPLISILTKGNRRWRGDLQYRFRMASNFGNQGILCAAPVYGVKHGLQLSNYFSNALPMFPNDASYLSSFANSFTYQDASMFRHLEVTLPWQKPYEWEDHYANLNNVLHQANNNIRKATNDYVTLGPDASPNVFDFIALYLRGNLPATSTTNSIDIEIDIKAGENFEFSGECFYRSPLPQFSADFQQRPAVTTNNVIPGHFSIPSTTYHSTNLEPIQI